MMTGFAMDILEAHAIWSRPRVHEQRLRRLALDALALLAPDILRDARDASSTPDAWASQWSLVTSAGHPARWVVAAVVLDRDLAGAGWTAPPSIWLLPYSDVSGMAIPTLPDNDRRRLVGAAQWRAEVRETLAAIEAADPSAPAHVVSTTGDGNLKRDLLLWADKVVRLSGRTPEPWPPGEEQVPSDPQRAIQRIAQRLGLAPPRKPGGRPKHT